MKKNQITIISKITIALLLLLCLLDMPYAYYQFMKIAVCALFIWMGYTYYQKEQIMSVIICGGGAILFNPMVKFALYRNQWNIIDLWLGVGLIAWILLDLIMYRFNRIRKENLSKIVKL